MIHAKPAVTPLAVDPPLTKVGSPYSNPTEYRALIDSLQYLGITRPDLAFCYKQISTVYAISYR